MGFRTVVITKQCKCSYKNGYLVIIDDEVKSVHLSEIETVVIDTTAVSITGYLLCQLSRKKITVIFCDEHHAPYASLASLAGSHNTSRRLRSQIEWTQTTKDRAWQHITKEKILNQAECLYRNGRDGVEQLVAFAADVQPGDITNREGHAAKVYFNCLFGAKWVRGGDDSINAALDYGYSILLAAIAKEIVANGYVTQLGINHCNEFNEFNLACDFMEPFRPMIDQIVVDTLPEQLDVEAKCKLLDFFNKEIRIKDSNYYMNSVLRFYVSNALRALSEGEADMMIFPERICENELCVR